MMKEMGDRKESWMRKEKLKGKRPKKWRRKKRMKKGMGSGWGGGGEKQMKREKET